MTQNSRSPRCIVIGGSKGIGRAIAELLAGQGAAVGIAARDIDQLRAVAGDFAARGIDVHVTPCDVRDADDVTMAIRELAGRLGGIDVLVNCASSFAREDNEDAWSAAFETDLMGPVRALKAALPFLRQSSDPAVINVSSVSGHQATPDRIPYGAMKAALEQYTASASVLHAGSGIRINCVVPGSTDIPGGIWDRIRQGDPALYEAAVRSVPLGRLARPEEIAEAAAFLASRKARWITGQCIVVDGGQIAGRRP